MQAGSNEWFKKLNENYKFSLKIAFVLIKERDGNTSIFSTEIKSKSQIENVKYSHISKDTWNSEGSAVLLVKEIKDASHYLQEIKRLKVIWGFALIKKEAI
ncbi:hypothetical protein KDN24_06970 [Bacillus sp. Bva_UNVM-123]|uniref:hypothetical protein n=1 Tax=Bacillus sp. Bva_UNVM-123 TaxID=2829798 RepID=UPI00391F3E79